MIWLLRALVFLSVFWTGVSARATTLSLTSAGPSGIPSASLPGVPFCSGTDTTVGHTTVTCTTTAAVPAHDTIVVVIGDGNVAGLTNISSVADGTNTYTEQASVYASTNTSAIWYVLDPATLASGSTITVTFSGSGAATKYVQAFYMSGTAVAVSSTVNGGSSTTPSCTANGAATRTSFATANMVAGNDTITQPAGWTAGNVGNVTGTFEESIGYKTNTDSSNAVYNPTGWSSAAWTCALATFQIGGYIGPGDIIGGASVWYGLRCYNAAKASASQAIRIRRASDNTESDIGLTAACALDVATATTFCAATSCFVTKVYDQSGNGKDVSQATQANQPALLFNCQGSLPCLNPTGTNMFLSGTLAAGVSQPVTLVNMVRRVNGPTNGGDIFTFFSAGGLGIISGFRNVANTIISYDSTGNTIRTATASDAALHVNQHIFNGASSAIKVDATKTTVSLGAAAADTAIGLLSRAAGGVGFDGYWGESGMWPALFTTGQLTSMCSNVHTYWSTPAAC